MASIIQWNCRGLMANRLEMELLANKHTPASICLQETMYQANKAIKFKQFTPYHVQPNSDDRSHGGVALLVAASHPHSYIKLNTPFQAVAIRLTLHKTISICNVYLPPNRPIDKYDLVSLINQLPRPAILLGDFNAHNPLWGSDHFCRPAER